MHGNNDTLRNRVETKRLKSMLNKLTKTTKILKALS